MSAFVTRFAAIRVRWLICFAFFTAGWLTCAAWVFLIHYSSQTAINLISKTGML